MKRFAVLIVLLMSVGAFAKERIWQDATVVMVRGTERSGGTASFPINGANFNVPLTTIATYYRLETSDMIYILVWSGHKHPLDVTIHGKTKIAVDGTMAHVLDDSNKDVKLPIVEKGVKPN